MQLAAELIQLSSAKLRQVDSREGNCREGLSARCVVLHYLHHEPSY